MFQYCPQKPIILMSISQMITTQKKKKKNLSGFYNPLTMSLGNKNFY